MKMNTKAMNKTDLKYLNINPFADLRDFSRVASADIPKDIDFPTIEGWAKEKTPKGYFLKSITTNGEIVKTYPHPNSKNFLNQE